jgi:hypothetical protein
MRVTPERWKKTRRVLCHESQLFEDEILLCAFDEGFLLGFEFAQSSSPNPGVPVRMVLTPQSPKENT